MTPKPKSHVYEIMTDEEEQLRGIDDLVDDPILRAEMKALEEASLRDFLSFEERLGGEDG